MTDDERGKFEQAFDQLFELAEWECYGDAELGQEHRCSCGPCVARRARTKIEEAIDPPHVSLQENRLTSPPERVFLEKWRKENVRQRGLNSGFTLLEWILCPAAEKRPASVSQRDAQVAASVVQWMGTNCGLSFLWECDTRIKELDHKFRGIRNTDVCFMGNDEWNGPIGTAEMQETAEYVAGHFFPITNERFTHLKRAILRCMIGVEKQAALPNVPAL